MDGEPRLTQLARLLGCPVEELQGAAGEARIAAGAGRIAEGLFEEAAASDDVVSTEGALDYLELRLAYLGDLLPGDTVAAVRARFMELTRQWE